MYTDPEPGGSLLVSLKPNAKRDTVLILGTNQLAAIRAVACIEAGYCVKVLSDGLTPTCPELAWRHDRQQLDLTHIKNLDEVLICLQDSTIAFLLVTDTLNSTQARSVTSLRLIIEACFSARIPINIADKPNLSDFTFPSTHRFPLALAKDDQLSKSPLQLAIATNGSSCRLATRIRRLVIAALPLAIGDAVDKVATLRQTIKDRTTEQIDVDAGTDGDWTPQVNTPVEQRGQPILNDALPVKKKDWIALARMRFIAQISEYWPIEQIATLTDSEIDRLFELSQNSTYDSPMTSPTALTSRHQLHSPTVSSAIRPGHIYLVGSGPGSPALLTRAAYEILTSKATVILSDKLVPSQILALIPSTTKFIIAKKFPGNAEGAQSELMDLALEEARNGQIVVRLKQGDVFLYGRGGEEVLFFRKHGFECTVIPGLSSTLAVPSIANIPVTQRGVSESVIICTGVGRGGKGVKLPGYQLERTLVVLMGVARLSGVVHALTSKEGQEIGRQGGERDGLAYPLETPIAILERGTSPDQRVVASTLAHIVEAMESLDEQRAPAMMVIGWSVMCLEGHGFVKVLDADHTALQHSTSDWLKGKKWSVREGLPAGWSFDQ